LAAIKFSEVSLKYFSVLVGLDVVYFGFKDFMKLLTADGCGMPQPRHLGLKSEASLAVGLIFSFTHILLLFRMFLNITSGIKEVFLEAELEEKFGWNECNRLESFVPCVIFSIGLKFSAASRREISE